MGAMFKLEHSNIVAYLTSNEGRAPRSQKSDVQDFLTVLEGGPSQYLIAAKGYEDWPAKMASRAADCLSILRSKSTAFEDTMPSESVAEVLAPLKQSFAHFGVFALAVGGGYELKEAAIELSRIPTGGVLLVLIPDMARADGRFEILDPMPAFSVAIHSAADWPGFLFWTRGGTSTFVPLKKMDSVAGRIATIAKPSGKRSFSPASADKKDIELEVANWAQRDKYQYKRLLHLSDLHFGTREATENQPLLEAELRDVVRAVDRVVITGDLFDTPKPDYATIFTTFRNNITHLAGGREPIAITGNHDQRIMGILGEDYKQVARIGSQKIVVDDQIRMVFICFNSSIEGFLARGKITQAQFREVGAEYRALLSAREHLRNYLPIVLVHHHPFSFDVAPETWVQRALSRVGLRDEATLELVDARELHDWCFDWEIRTILHGHKHKPRYIERDIQRHDDIMPLTAIGCGSSLGAEGLPMSYNLLEWQPDARRWVASFFQSENGGAFREIATSVSPTRASH